jgi:transposase
MEEGITVVGMDTSKKKIQPALLLPEQTNPTVWEIPNEASAIRRMVRKVQRQAPGEVVFVYEAGPCGYALQRQIESLKSRCVVIAPSLVPKKPGERIKTNRRDAKKLAMLYRGGLLTEVRPPTPEEEAMRDVCRAREDEVEDRQSCRHRLSKFLLRRGCIYTAGRNWTQGHWRWLRAFSFENEADRAVFENYLLAVEQAEARLENLEKQLIAFADTEPYRERVGWLRCFRGIDTITAMTVVCEIHGIERFETARELMAYLGLVASEFSTGDKQWRGRITGTGNCHVRRVLTEACHPYRYAPTARGNLAKRRAGQPAWAIAIADKAQQRLHKRFWHLMSRKLHYGKVIVALERELVGFLWAVLTQGQAIKHKAA